MTCYDLPQGPEELSLQLRAAPATAPENRHLSPKTQAQLCDRHVSVEEPLTRETGLTSTLCGPSGPCKSPPAAAFQQGDRAVVLW